MNADQYQVLAYSTGPERGNSWSGRKDPQAQVIGSGHINEPSTHQHAVEVDDPYAAVGAGPEVQV